jgi:hypothetical protein
MTEEQLQAIMKKNPALKIVWSTRDTIIPTTPKRSKYGNVKENWYDSKKESARAFQLKCMEKAGVIINLKEQVPFVLQEWFIGPDGKKVRPITYIADFTYEQYGEKVAEDVKSKWTITPIYKMKKKMFWKQYPEILFLETI